ncbi:uncharacterized protein K444DRAFT_611378 [Hyaloscypha bicolor E]|uniref:Uncharacterized protein n=1 Tax=Hyaloscypha bicolor E TaxID=1095630 RepID=A0A2J6TDM0_9HELO|nr:uncharacterized protein K444DRAFT_611378 [Hyaloscypha bicolor E]PMD61103.1 hypothetical protein K444DRAFT_611378 [Hyaloscypha bicolor E]
MNARRHDLKDSLSVLVVDLVERDGDTLVCEAIDLAARLWIMVDIGQLSWGFVPGQKSMQWEDGKLTELLHNRFGDPGPSKLGIRVKLERLFTARNLERIAGLQIVWTSNLSDHLKLKDDDTRVAIFYHATFLKHHNKECHPFPPGFFEETERTLALLIPQYDINSTRWFKIQQRKFGLDYMASSTGHLTTEERQIENFVFWHDRLCILKQVFDEAEPGTIAQWWCDRRRRVQWYTFWVAALVLALTIFFGMIQCVEGGLQVYKAYYPS